MESTGSKQNVLLQKELPFGEKILRQYFGLLLDEATDDSLWISRQQFLKLLEINVNT